MFKLAILFLWFYLMGRVTDQWLKKRIICILLQYQRPRWPNGFILGMCRSRVWLPEGPIWETYLFQLALVCLFWVVLRSEFTFLWYSLFPSLRPDWPIIIIIIISDIDFRLFSFFFISFGLKLILNNEMGKTTLPSNGIVGGDQFNTY